MKRPALRSLWYLGGTLGGVIVSLLVLPLATKLIGSREYGALAIALSIGAIVSSAGSAVIGYVVSENFQKVSLRRRDELVSSCVIAAMVASLLAALITAPVAVALLPRFLDVSPQTSIGTTICVLATALGAPWLVACEVLMLDGRASVYSLGTVAQSATNGAFTLGFLYLHPMPELALFLGYAMGQIVLLLFAYVALRAHLVVPRERRWFAAMRRTLVPVARASFIDSGRTLFERNYLGAWASVADVGLLAHAQLYRSWAMISLNAVSRAIWPINLAEARVEPPEFAITNAAWTVVQAGIACACVGFALFGAEIIDLLTSGKLVASAPLAVVLLGGLLVQTAGKHQMTVLIARGQSGRYADATTLSGIAGLVFLIVLVPLFGPMGAAVATVLQYLTLRTVVIFAARELVFLPFRDRWVIVGLCAALAGQAWLAFANPGMGARVAVMLSFAVAAALVAWKPLLVFIRHRDGVQAEPGASDA